MSTHKQVFLGGIARTESGSEIGISVAASAAAISSDNIYSTCLCAFLVLLRGGDKNGAEWSKVGWDKVSVCVCVGVCCISYYG